MMAGGSDGWNAFPLVTFADGKQLALIFFTFPPKPGKKIRKLGHVGMLISPVFGGKLTRMAHASGTYGFISVTITEGDYFHKYHEALRQVTE